MGDAAIVVDLRKSRVIVPDCLAIVGDRARVVVPSGVDETAIVICERVGRIAPDRLAIVGEGEIEVVPSRMNAAAIVVCGGEVRI